MILDLDWNDDRATILLKENAISKNKSKWQTMAICHPPSVIRTYMEAQRRLKCNEANGFPSHSKVGRSNFGNVPTQQK